MDPLITASMITALGALFAFFDKLRTMKRDASGKRNKWDVVYATIFLAVTLVGSGFAYYAGNKARIAARQSEIAAARATEEARRRAEEVITLQRQQLELQREQRDTSRHIIRLNNKIIDLQADLSELQKESLKQLKGGDSCFILFFPFRDQLSIYLVNKDQYPLRYPRIRLLQPIQRFEHPEREDSDQTFNIDYVPGRQESMGTNYIIGTQNSVLLSVTKIPPGEKIIVYVATIVLGNEELTQMTKLYLVNDQRGGDRWVTATRVLSKLKKRAIITDVMPEFPTDSTGRVNWTVMGSMNDLRRMKE